MADKLTGSLNRAATGAKGGATVHQLPTRAAKGAGKSKPAKAPPQMKSSAPTPKPKTQAERDMEIRGANLDRRRVLASQDRQIDVKVEVLREQLKTLLGDRKQVRSAIEGTGIPLALYDEAKKDSLTSRVDLEEKERLRADAREIFGVPTGVERGLFDGLGDTARETVHWDDMGYREGLAGGDRDPPSTCPKERANDYRTGYDRAQTEMAGAIERTKASTTGAAPSSTPLEDAAKAGKQPPENPDASHVSAPAGNENDDGSDAALDAEADALIDQAGREADAEFESSQEELDRQSARIAGREARQTDAELAPHGTAAQASRLNPTEELAESMKTSGPAVLAKAGGII